MNPILQSPFFASFPSLAHGFTTRLFTHSTHSYMMPGCTSEMMDPNEAAQYMHNRSAVMNAMNWPAKALSLVKQVHGADVVTVVESLPFDNAPMADAQVTHIRGIMLGVLSADCVPVLFYDPLAEIIGAAHAGWRSALAGVIANTITAMEKLGAKSHQIHALIGPCIHQPSYEVGPEVRQAFLAENANFDIFFQPNARTDHYQFDLPGLVAARLKDAGVIHLDQWMEDTYCHPEKWFSYRLSTHKSQPYPGSIVSMIGMKD